MLDITIIAIGKLKDPNFSAAYKEYLKRIKPFARVKIKELSALSFSEGEEEKIKKEESYRILEKIKKFEKNKVFLLSENGKEYSSQEFSNLIEKENSEAVFVIAGSLGFFDEIFDGYKRLSLSKMTFPHEMARMILVEQLYRASTIINGKKYHH